MTLALRALYSVQNACWRFVELSCRVRYLHSIHHPSTINGGGVMERVKGIEPSPKAWEAFILPLNYTRIRGNLPTPCGPVKPSYRIALKSALSGRIQFSSTLGGRFDGIHQNSA